MDTQKLRKINGVNLPDAVSEPSVISRRKAHKLGVTLASRLSFFFQCSCFVIGAFVVLFPALSSSYRRAISGIPVVSDVFRSFSEMRGASLLILLILIGLFLARAAVSKYVPSAYSSSSTFRDIEEMELYPRNKKEELAFWIDVAFGVSSSLVWLYLPFGVVSYFITLGGR